MLRCIHNLVSYRDDDDYGDSPARKHLKPYSILLVCLRGSAVIQQAEAFCRGTQAEPEARPALA